MAITKDLVIGHLENVREECATVIEQVVKIIGVVEGGGKITMREYDRLMDGISDLKHDGELMLDRLGMGGFVNEGR